MGENNFASFSSFISKPFQTAYVTTRALVSRNVLPAAVHSYTDPSELIIVIVNLPRYHRDMSYGEQESGAFATYKMSTSALAMSASIFICCSHPGVIKVFKHAEDITSHAFEDWILKVKVFFIR